MSCPDRIDDIDLDGLDKNYLDQNYILSTQSDSDNSFQGDFIKRFWRFVTGKNEQSNSLIISKPQMDDCISIIINTLKFFEK